MNIKIENEKKVYVAPAMDVVNMDHELILCCSAGDDPSPWCSDDIESTTDEFN